MIFRQQSEFEKRFGRYAVPNLSLYLILCYVAGYIMELINPAIVIYLSLDPFLILKGQIWRLVTWILVPPDTSNFLMVAIMCYFYYSIGTTLERTWGTYRYNIYLFGGMLCTILGSFALLLYCKIIGYTAVEYSNGGWLYMLENGTPVSFMLFSTFYINMSIFLAFAATYPDMKVLLMFIIPVKVKWLGIIYALLLISDCTKGVVMLFVIGSSLLNFLIYFLRLRRGYRTPRQMHQAARFKQETRKAQGAGVTRHRCAVCGRTENDDPSLEFRFCSKCYGNFEYCKDHLYTHEHVLPPHTVD